MAYEYKTRYDIEADEDLINSGDDLLDADILNRPHEILAKNSDLMVPSLDYLSQKFGEDYITTKTASGIPKYSDYDLGYTPYFIRDGMSFKEALVALDRGARDLKKFIKSRSKLPPSINPFTTHGEVITPIGNESDTSWIVVPDEIPVMPSVVDAPIANRCSGRQGPNIYVVSYDTPQHLIAMDSRRTGKGKGAAYLYQSYDGGNTWQRILEYSGHYMYSWTYLAIQTSMYRNRNDQIEMALGLQQGNPHVRYLGRATYDKPQKRWSFSLTTGLVKSEHYSNLVLRRSLTRKCLAIWCGLYNNFVAIRHDDNDWSEWGASVDITKHIYMKNTFDGGDTWYRVLHPDIIQYTDGKILAVFAGKRTSNENWAIWKSVSYDNGYTFSDPEILLGGTEYNYLSPSLMYLFNGGTVLGFITDEGKTVLGAPNIVKVAVSYDKGENWYNKVKVYEGSNYYVPNALYIGVTLRQLGNGTMLCFMENPVSIYDSRTVKVRLRIEV